MSLSIIVCSIRPNELRAFEENIRSTIGSGVEYEILAHDNREARLSLAEAYNSCARRAKYDNLLFVHEDAGFVTHDWYAPIAAKLAENDCGAIGFAGSKLLTAAPGGWNVAARFSVVNVQENGVDYTHNSREYLYFEPAVALDGFMIFVRREVWKEFPFDEELLTGFHCYDVDFSLTIAQKYKNYICSGIRPYHNSPGKFEDAWMLATGKMFREKWHSMLPCKSFDLEVSDRTVRYFGERVWFRYLKMLMQSGYPTAEWWSGFMRFPLRWRHLRHILKYPYLKLKYAGRRKKRIG